MMQNVDSARRKNFDKKCAIDRHLSTEHFPKLRLWRLFDRQNIHECARYQNVVLSRRAIISVVTYTRTRVLEMGPPETPQVELVRILLWWSIWSLLDFYGLPYSPVSELLVILAVCIALLLIRLYSDVKLRLHRTKQRIPEEDHVGGEHAEG